MLTEHQPYGSLVSRQRYALIVHYELGTVEEKAALVTGL